MWKRTDHTVKRMENRSLFDKVPDFVSEQEIDTYKGKTLYPRHQALEKRFR